MKNHALALLLLIAMCVVGACKGKETSNTTAPDTSPSEAQRAVAKEAILAKNKATLAGMNLAATPRWTPAVQRQRFIAESELDSAKCSGSDHDFPCNEVTVGAWCPEAKSILAKPDKDEFDAKKHKHEAMKARQVCLDRIRVAVGPRPELAVAEVALEPEAYEFEHHHYLLESKPGGANAFVATTWSADTFVLALSTVGPTDCTAKDPSEGVELGLLVVKNAAGPSVGPARTWESGCFKEGCDLLCATLDMSEQAAQGVKARLSADDDVRNTFLRKGPTAKVKDVSSFLRLQLALGPEAYGVVDPDRRCKVMMTRGGITAVMSEDPIRGFPATGVGYRILDSQGVLIDWTPMGPAK